MPNFVEGLKLAAPQEHLRKNVPLLGAAMEIQYVVAHKHAMTLPRHAPSEEPLVVAQVGTLPIATTSLEAVS
jgi:hypothetical protein